MNKLAILVLISAIIACAKRPGSRPEMYSKEERFLSNGLLYYQKDNFPAAQQNFNHALILYQSVDNSRGSQLARINLVESFLALNNFDAVDPHLAILKQSNEVIRISLKNRVVLLEVKLLFKKQRYREALATLEPLLLQLDSSKKNAHKRLGLLATAARLETLIAMPTEHQWLKQFRTALLQQKNILPKFQVMLIRIDAIIAVQNQQYNTALQLLDEALVYYKTQAQRRSIAACLEEIAEIKFKQHNNRQALEYLKRALTIRVWLKDAYTTDEIQKRMMQIKSLSTTPLLNP